MPDNTTDVPSGESSADGDRFASISAALREARESIGISVDEVVHELNLSRESILALEAGDFDQLGAPVFVKGHLRNYARLLELDEQKLVDAFVTPEQPAEEFRTLSRQPVVRPGASLSGFALWIAAGVVVLIGLIYLLSGGSSEPADEAVVDTAAAVPDAAGASEVPAAGESRAAESLAADPVTANADAAEPAEEPEPAELPVATVEPEAPEPQAEPEPAPEPQVVAAEPLAEAAVATAIAEEPAAATVPATPMQLQFSFTDDCWVEIRDSRRQLSFGLQTDGKVLDLEAVPPVKILLGNAAAVEMQIDGEPYTIPRNPGSRSKAARFELTEDTPR